MDAYRGLVMCLMMAEVLRLAEVASRLPGGTFSSFFWSLLAFHQTHAPWAGCSLHDLIQPSFSFLVGVALPFSIAARQARGQSQGRMTAHAFWRAFVLVALGIFLRSIGFDHTRFTFEDTLTQIGLGYGILFMLGFRPTRDAWIALGLILAGYWAAFALYPLPGPGFDWSQTGTTPDWAYNYTGFAAHWNKNTNLAWAFDRWFLNQLHELVDSEHDPAANRMLLAVHALDHFIVVADEVVVARHCIHPRIQSEMHAENVHVLGVYVIVAVDPNDKPPAC